jgi:N-glycosylase/DNA lyase
MKGVCWGHAEAMFTPAFWAAQAWYHRNSTRYSDFAWGDDLRREIVGCLLGGHGISSEMNQAAFERLDRSGLLIRSGPFDEEEILEFLRIPFTVAGRPVRYRFAAQKSRFVTAALRKIEQDSKPVGGAPELREWLLSFPGIGMKTASWITRNHLRTNTVAVIDIHIFRAGVIMGLYSGREVVPRDYVALEEKFLRFADRIGVLVNKLDVIIWRTMKDSHQLGLNSYRNAA